ncbi:MAG: rhomboid family intramembrane serine protease [Luminiphilus sp.]
MRSFNKLPVAIQRAPATFSLVVATTICFLLFYPLQWVGMLELFNFVPFRAAGGYVAFGEWGDWWRLVTPTLIHFGWLHVVFNCLWLWEFGQRIEHRLGGINLLGLYVISAMASNFCQYWWEGPSIFGGMSGVVYALLGIIMASHWRRPGWIAPPPMAVFAFMLIWLVIGMSGSMALLGADAIANGAHVGGLVAGWVLGLLVSSAPALFRKS